MAAACTCACATPAHALGYTCACSMVGVEKWDWAPCSIFRERRVAFGMRHWTLEWPECRRELPCSLLFHRLSVVWRPVSPELNGDGGVGPNCTWRIDPPSPLLRYEQGFCLCCREGHVEQFCQRRGDLPDIDGPEILVCADALSGDYEGGVHVLTGRCRRESAV